jgi:hypothetical protein
MKNKYILLIILVSFILRSFLLGSFPTGISNDELHFILNAKTVLLNYTDIIGSNWNPLSLKTIPGETSSELIFPIFAPLVGLLPLSLFYSKIFYVFFGVGSILLVYHIANILFSSKIALISSLVFCFNPYSIYVNRSAFDAPIAMFFFLLFIYLLLQLKNWKILFSFIPAFIGFYCYIGTKVIFLPFVIISAIFVWYFKKRPYFKPYLLLILLALVLTLFYVFSLNSGSSARLGELISPQNQTILIQSQTDKDQSLRSPFKIIFSNPFSFSLKYAFEKYLNNFSPSVLFLNGDPTFMVSLWKHGYFYYFDVVFILVGFYFLFKYHRLPAIFITSLILLSPIPEAIRIDKIPAYAFHSTFQYPFFYMVIAIGIYYTLKNYSYLKKIILFSYFILFLNFIDVYFFRYPVYQSEGFFFSRRLLSRQLSLENKDQKIFVLSNEPESLFRNFLFFQNKVNILNLPLIKNQYRLHPLRDQFVWDNITFTKNSQIIDQTATVIVEDKKDYSLLEYKNKYLISRLSDPSPLFTIYNSSVCSSANLDRFVHNLNIADFAVEKLSQDQFCTKFFIKN